MLAKVTIVAVAVALSFAQSYGGSSYGYGNLDEYKYPPRPYKFGYQTNDDYGTVTFRNEDGDGSGRVQGSYGYKDLQGLERLVDYVADEKGFRAQIKTNEPGTDNQNPADVEIVANPVIANYASQKYAATSQSSYASLDQPYASPRPRYSGQLPAYAAARSAYAAPRQSYGGSRASYEALKSPYEPLRPYGGGLRPSYGSPRPSYPTSRLY